MKVSCCGVSYPHSFFIPCWYTSSFLSLSIRPLDLVRSSVGVHAFSLAIIGAVVIATIKKISVFIRCSYFD